MQFPTLTSTSAAAFLQTLGGEEREKRGREADDEGQGKAKIMKRDVSDVSDVSDDGTP